MNPNQRGQIGRLIRTFWRENASQELTKGYKSLQLDYGCEVMDMTRFSNFFALFLIAGLMAIVGCGGDTEDTHIQLSIPTRIGGTIDQGQALVVSASGLVPREFPVLLQAITDTGEIASGARLTADALGRIDDVILSYDVGLIGTSGDGRLAPGVFTVRLTASGGTVEREVTVAALIAGPRIWACDIDGEPCNAFLSGDPVYIAAAGLQQGTTYRVWPVEDRREWLDGDVFTSWQADYPAIVWPDDIPEFIDVVAGPGGYVYPTLLLPYATKHLPGVTDQFDIVLDREPFGVFDAATDAVDSQLPTGVVVQDPTPDGHIITELACREDYTYTNHFKVGEEVYIWLNPGVIIPVDIHSYVMKYIVDHTSDWTDKMSLTDITEGVEIDVVQPGCANEGLILAWAHAELGEYDVVIDMNANGVYDQGLDVLDGGPIGPGFRVTE